MGAPVNTLSKKIVIKNELGLHARPAARIAKLARKATSSVWIIRDNEKIDASSVIDILTLACMKGTKIVIQIDDHSDLNILSQIITLIENSFEE